MSSTYLSPSQILQARAIIHNLLHIGHLSSVGVKEVSISFPLLSALLAGLLLQHMLHTSVCFASCNHFDLGSRVVGLKYWYSSWKKTKNNNNSFWRKMELILPPSLLLYYTRPKTSITSACFSSNSYIGSMSTCPLTTPTKSHPHKFNYCHHFFVMPSALTKVKFTQSSIALQ